MITHTVSDSRPLPAAQPCGSLTEGWRRFRASVYFCSFLDSAASIDSPIGDLGSNLRTVPLVAQIQISKMSFSEVVSCSRQLAEEINEREFSPTAVVGIATGGLVPASLVAKHLGCPLIVIAIARPFTGAKGRLGLRHLPRRMKKMLRRLEMSLGLFRRMKQRKIMMVSGDLKPGKYVIVDDSLDTGNTMRVALEYLSDTMAIPRSDVLLASLTQIFDDASPPADVCLYRRVNFEFPWSQDSPEYPKFLSYCATEFPDR